MGSGGGWGLGGILTAASVGGTVRDAVRLAVLKRLPVAVHLTLKRKMKAPQDEQT